MAIFEAMGKVRVTSWFGVWERGVRGGRVIEPSAGIVNVFWERRFVRGILGSASLKR